MFECVCVCVFEYVCACVCLSESVCVCVRWRDGVIVYLLNQICKESQLRNVFGREWDGPDDHTACKRKNKSIVILFKTPAASKLERWQDEYQSMGNPLLNTFLKITVVFSYHSEIWRTSGSTDSAGP